MLEGVCLWRKPSSASLDRPHHHLNNKAASHGPKNSWFLTCSTFFSAVILVSIVTVKLLSHPPDRGLMVSNVLKDSHVWFLWSRTVFVAFVFARHHSWPPCALVLEGKQWLFMSRRSAQTKVLFPGYLDDWQESYQIKTTWADRGSYNIKR